MRERILQHINEVEKLLYDNSSVALSEARQAVELSKEFYYEDLLAVSTMLMGTVEFNRGNINSGTEMLNEAIVYATNCGDALTTGRCYNVLGTIHNHQGAFEEALDCYLGYYDAVKDLDKPMKKASALNNIGEIYRRIGEADIASTYYEQAFSLVKDQTDSVMFKICYMNMAEMLLDNGDYDKPEKMLHELLDEHCRKHSVIHGVVLSLLGRLYSLNQKPMDAEVCYEEAFEIAMSDSQSIESMQVVFDYAKHCHRYDQDDKALELLHICLNQSLGIQGADFIIEVTDVMRRIYDARGSFDDSVKMRELQLIKFHELRDFQRQMRANGIKRQADIKRLREIHLATQKSNEELKEKHHNILVQKQSLEEELKYLQLVNTIGRDIARTRDIDEIVKLLFQRINDMFSFDLAGIGHIDDDAVELVYVSYDLKVDRSKYSGNINIVPKVVESMERVVINDLSKEYKKYYTDEEYDEVANKRFPSKSILYEPLIFEGECIGVLTLQSMTANQFNEDILSVAEIVASFTAIALKNNITFIALENEIDEREKAKSELIRVNKILEQRANMDGLTGVFNKRSFSQELEEYWLTARDTKTPLGMMIIDIDDFKNYNDNYGHLQGDDIIKLVANTLMEELPEEFIARFGGEEFVVLMENVDALKMVTAASGILGSIRRKNEPHAFSHVDDKITVSIGVGMTTPGDGDRSAEFFSYVDHLMYMAKEKGKNQYYTNFFDDGEN